MTQLESNENSRFDKFLNWVEKVGNKLPEPLLLFAALSAVVVLLSYILSLIGFSDIHPVTKEPLQVINLLSVAGLQKILANMVTNFSTFPPLGIVLTCMLGVGLCERSGLFSTLLRSSLTGITGSKVKVVVLLVFVSIVANAAGDSGFIIMPPIGAMIFSAVGRNPLAGMMCAYASVAGAFSANFMVTSLDTLLIGFTEPAAMSAGIPVTGVHAMMNYYFQAFSVITLTVVATWVTLKVLEPRLGPSKHAAEALEEVTPQQKKALKKAGIALLIYFIILALGIVPTNGILRDPETHSAIATTAPLMKGLVVLIALAFFIPGLVYGKSAGIFKASKDVVAAFNDTMTNMGSYVAMSFFMGQFINFFGWSNIGILLAIKGANALQTSGFPIPVILVLFILLCVVLDIFLGSASAKWAIMAPIFIPMFMFLGFHPSLITMAYRIGDSVINIVTPLLAYFGMLLVSARKYDKSIGMGTLMADMLPYSMSFLVVWTVQLLIWYFLKLPMGPGSPLMLP